MALLRRNNSNDSHRRRIRDLMAVVISYSPHAFIGRCFYWIKDWQCRGGVWGYKSSALKPRRCIDAQRGARRGILFVLTTCPYASRLNITV